MWRGKDWKSRYHAPLVLVPKISTKDAGTSSSSGETDDAGDGKLKPNKVAPSSKMMSLWKRALESNRSMLLVETELSPDTLLERVEEFEGLSQATEHSYPALILSGGGAETSRITEADSKDINEDGNYVDRDEDDEEYDEYDDFCEELDSSAPFGSLPIDFIAEQLQGEM